MRKLFFICLMSLPVWLTAAETELQNHAPADSLEQARLDSLAHLERAQFERDSIFNDNATEAEELFNTSRFREAAEAYRGLLNRGFDPAVHFNLALCAYKLGEFSEAIRYFDRVLAVDSSNKDARYLKAMCAAQQGNLKVSLAEMKKLNRFDQQYDNLPAKIRQTSWLLFIARKWYYLLAILMMATVLLILIVKKDDVFN